MWDGLTLSRKPAMWRRIDLSEGDCDMSGALRSPAKDEEQTLSVQTVER